MSRMIAMLAAVVTALLGVAATPANAAIASIAIVQSGNIRQGPSTQHSIIGSLRAGTALTKEHIACYVRGERVGGGVFAVA